MPSVGVVFSAPLQTEALVAVGVVALVGVVLVGIAVREVVVGLRYRRRRPTPIGDLGDASGRVTVTGVARRVEDLVRAPVTRTECLAYTWRVSDLRTERGLDGSIRTRRHDVGQGRDSTAFLVADDTGSVRVDPTGAEFRLAESWVADPVGDPVDRPDVLTGADPVGGGARAREYYEARLDEGETVTVRGRVRPDADGPVTARQVGVVISGGGTLVDDATPGAAARRAFRQAAYAGLTGLFVLGILAWLFFAG